MTDEPGFNLVLARLLLDPVLARAARVDPAGTARQLGWLAADLAVINQIPRQDFELASRLSRKKKLYSLDTTCPATVRALRQLGHYEAVTDDMLSTVPASPAKDTSRPARLVKGRQLLAALERHAEVPAYLPDLLRLELLLAEPVSDPFGPAGRARPPAVGLRCPLLSPRARLVDYAHPVGALLRSVLSGTITPDCRPARTWYAVTTVYREQPRVFRITERMSSVLRRCDGATAEPVIAARTGLPPRFVAETVRRARDVPDLLSAG